MKTVAVFNMKGGVGKTTAAVNLSYLAAAAGRRTLLWDLDPQAASTFTFRVRPDMPGFGKESVQDGRVFAAAVKETDYQNLYLLPADFAYRKFERYLDALGRPKRLIASLLGAIGHDFDIVFLDCPAGFSLLIEGLLAAADAIVVPVVPTVLSLRTLTRLLGWADRSDAQATVAAFLNMVDRRKMLHRQAADLCVAHPDVFLAAQVPYASVVEEMAVRRMPLPAFGGREAATAAFAQIWAELETRLRQEGPRDAAREDRWASYQRTVESLIEQLQAASPEPSDADCPADGSHGARVRQQVRRGASRSTVRDRGLAVRLASGAASEEARVAYVHGFDTDARDLERSGHGLELHECQNHRFFVIARSRSGDVAHPSHRAQVRVDAVWALEILSGERSPLTALDSRLGRPGPRVLESLHAIVDGHSLRRVETRLARSAAGDDRPGQYGPETPAGPRLVRPARRPEAEPEHLARIGDRSIDDAVDHAARST